jgi:hypothetical protein
MLDEETSKIYGEIYSFFEKINPNTKFLLKESTPEYISKHIAMTEDDINELINQSIIAKDWVKLISVGNRIDKLTLAQKQKVFSIKNESSFHKVFMEYFGDKINLQTANYNLSFFDITCLMSLISTSFMNKIISNSIDNIEDIIETFITIYRIGFRNFDDYENNIFELFITSLLFGKLENQALNIFDKLIIFDAELIDKHKIIYYSILRLLDKKIDKSDDLILDKINAYTDGIKEIQIKNSFEKDVKTSF